MSATKITGQNAVFYWALENGFLNGGSPMPASNGIKHQPWNPPEGRINLIYPSYLVELVYTSGDLKPNANLSYTSELRPGDGLLPNERGYIYHDPMAMLALVFPHKEISGSWAGGAGTYGQIIGNFSDYDDIDTIMSQYALYDDQGAVVEEKTFNGIIANEFRIGFDKGKHLREKYSILSAFEQNNTRAYSADANFDDGKWADWARSTYYHATECKVFWDNAHAAQFADINVFNCWFIIRIPKEYNVESASLTPFTFNQDNMRFTAEIYGNIKGDTELDELFQLLSAKTKKDLRLQWDETASEEKHLTIDNAYISSISEKFIPAGKEKYEATLTLEGFDLAYEGNFENLPDPSTRITTSP